MDYNLDDAAPDAAPKAEIQITYRGLDMEGLLLVEEAYVVNGFSTAFSTLVAAGRAAITQS